MMMSILKMSFWMGEILATKEAEGNNDESGVV